MLLRNADEVAPQGRTILEAIDRGSDRINNVVQDLLDISKLQAGQLALNLERIDMAEMVAEIVKRAAITARKHRVRLVNSDHAVVQGDRDRLEQAVSQLMETRSNIHHEAGIAQLCSPRSRRRQPVARFLLREVLFLVEGPVSSSIRRHMGSDQVSAADKCPRPLRLTVQKGTSR